MIIIRAFLDKERSLRSFFPDLRLPSLPRGIDTGIPPPKKFIAEHHECEDDNVEDGRGEDFADIEVGGGMEAGGVGAKVGEVIEIEGVG